MKRIPQALRDVVARLRRPVAARMRRLADRLDDRPNQVADRIDAPVDAAKSQGVVS